KVLRLRSMRTKSRQFVCALCVVRDNHAAIPCRAEILGWEKRKTPVVPNGSSSSPLMPSTNRLGSILDNNQTVSPSHTHHRRHICHLNVKMNGYNRASAGSNFRLDERRIDVVCDWIDIHKYRLGTYPGDRAGRGEKGVWGRDDFVSRPDAFRHEADQKGIGSRRNTHRKTAFTVGSYGNLTLMNFRPAATLLGIHHLFDGPV